MQVTIKNESEVEEKYPYIGIADNGDIVIFVKEREGFALKYDDGGLHYSKSWLEFKFKPFTGEIILKND